jgi:hypothetical protein
LNDGLAGLAYLRAMQRVDGRRIVIVGHSFPVARSHSSWPSETAAFRP